MELPPTTGPRTLCVSTTTPSTLRVATKAPTSAVPLLLITALTLQGVLGLIVDGTLTLVGVRSGFPLMAVFS